MDGQTNLLLLVYLANIIVAGWVGASAFFSPEAAGKVVFSRKALPSVTMQIVGAFWLSIALLSIMGLFRPLAFVPVLVVQLVYKGLWLVGVALPAAANGRYKQLPGGIVWFFLVWVIVLPFVIPWEWLF